MKFLKYFLYVIIGLIIIFFAFGLIHPSVSYGHEITVNKPVQETWAVAQDESKFDQWLEGFQSIELISGEKGEVGSKYKVVINPGNGQPELEMIQTVVSIKEFEEVELSFDSEMMVFDQKIIHSEANGRTTVKTEFTVSPKSMMTRSMFAMMEIYKGHLQRKKPRILRH